MALLPSVKGACHGLIIVTFLSLWNDFLRDLVIRWSSRAPLWGRRGRTTPPVGIIVVVMTCDFCGSAQRRHGAASACLRGTNFQILGRNCRTLNIGRLLIMLKNFAVVWLRVKPRNQRALLFEILLLFLTIFWWIYHSKEKSVLFMSYLIWILIVWTVRILLSRVWFVAGNESGATSHRLFMPIEGLRIKLALWYGYHYNWTWLLGVYGHIEVLRDQDFNDVSNLVIIL